jgi:hypothetical protein
MKNKSEMFNYFKDFYRSIQTQYVAVVKVLRSDNGTKFTNAIFEEYLSVQGNILSNYISIYTGSEWNNRKKERTSPRGS